MARTSPTKLLDGDQVLYASLQQGLKGPDIWLFQMLVARLIDSLGVWLHPAAYRALPVMVPYAIRDNASRGVRGDPDSDQWGAPNAAGYLRDDNSLVKEVPTSLVISAPRNPQYDGAKIKKGFVAAHAWTRTRERAAREDARTYSFIPNLVWLPPEIAKLTDRAGFAQTYLQALSAKIYRGFAIGTQASLFAEDSWAQLDVPHTSSVSLPDPRDLNFFVPTVKWLQTRHRKIDEVIAALKTLQDGDDPGERKVITTRYGQGLREMTAEDLYDITRDLSQYRSALPEPEQLEAFVREFHDLSGGH